MLLDTLAISNDGDTNTVEIVVDDDVDGIGNVGIDIDDRESLIIKASTLGAGGVKLIDDSDNSDIPRYPGTQWV